MKKRKVYGDLSEHYYGVRLYKDDIENILLFLNEKGFCEVKIYDSDSEYSNIEELVEHKGDRPNVIEIEAYQAHDEHRFRDVSIRINKNNIFLSVRNEGDLHYTTWSKLKNMIEKRRSIVYRFTDLLLWFIPIFVLVALLFWRARKIINADEEFIFKTFLIENQYAAFFLILSIFMYALGFYERVFCSTVYMKRQHESSFLKKHTGAIFVAIVSSFFSVIATVIATVLAKAYFCS